TAPRSACRAPGTAPRRRTVPWTWGRESGACARYGSRMFPVSEPMGNVGRDGARRRLAERSEAGPVVDVDQDRPVGLRERDVAAEYLESENRGRLEGERLEAVLVHHGALAGESRVRAVPIEKPPVGHAIKRHHGPGHVLLQGHPGNAAGGEGAQRLGQTVQGRRDHILRTLGVYVAALDPDLLVIGTEGAEMAGWRERGGAGEDERAGKRQRTVAESPDEPVPVAIQRARRAVHHHDAVGLERHELPRRQRARAHVEVERG